MASKTKPETGMKILPGVKVRTAAILRSWHGMGSSGPNVTQRRPDTIGVAHHALPGLTTWYVQHEGDACLTVYRTSELTPVSDDAMATGSSAVPTEAVTPDLTKEEQAKLVLGLMATIEQKRDALAAETRALINRLPDGSESAKSWIEEAARDIERVRLDSAKSCVIDAVRPRGPSVTITVKHRGNVSTYSSELSEVTSGAFVMFGGERYSRKTGQRISKGDQGFAPPSYYITAEERARVLALGWKPPKGSK